MPRYNIDFTDQQIGALKNIATTMGVSKAEVLRRAIALLNYATSELSSNRTRTLSITEGDEIIKDIVMPGL